MTLTYRELMADCGAPEYERIAVVARRSRKDRSCVYCSTGIKKGERYVRIIEKVDGDFGVIIAHDEHGYCADYEEA